MYNISKWKLSKIIKEIMFQKAILRKLKSTDDQKHKVWGIK